VTSRYIYVDESKRSRYVLVAVGLTDPAPIRRVVRGLILPGQRRLHMVRERDSRRREILSALAATQVEATIYNAARRYRTDREARAMCLTALVEDLVTAGEDSHIAIEQDDSLVDSDETTLYRSVHRPGRPERARTLHYDHERATIEPLLTLPDALAWAWSKAGDWRRRADPVISAVRQV